jgi:alkylhydroperoxidase/carboxymuconolactone decarboxylase family protein YurZ
MYLPSIFQRFKDEHPDIANALSHVGELCDKAGPLNDKNRHLVQLGIAVGASSKGGVRSHVRRALEAGATKDEIIQTLLLSTTIVGFPAMIAAYSWAEEVFAAPEKH